MDAVRGASDGAFAATLYVVYKRNTDFAQQLFLIEADSQKGRSIDL